ncbi:hypothetical protein BGX34_012061 [Mortierella sp. NVP85]|nr:hypothetical protein BGX34_012061 [Mortierella sp. NVP85]
MAAAPTLPFVVLRAHKPYSVDDIVSEAEQNPSFPGRSSPSSLNSRAPLRSSIPDVSSLASSNTPRSGPNNDTYTTNDIPGSTGAPSTSSPSTIHARTIHPQVHYIFENDPLEMDILASIPRSRCITLDLDPRSGSIKNVESFLPNLQVMDVKLVTSQAAMATSSGSSASLTATQTADGQGGSSTSNTASGIGPGGGNLMMLGRTGSSEALPLQSSFTASAASAASARMVGGSSERSLVNQAVDGDNQGIKGTIKEWGLVIEAMEMDEISTESGSELLEGSIISSLDTDMMPEDYLTHCEALLKSFSAR